MKTASQRFKNAIKEGISPILKDKGFKKKGLNYFRDLNELGHIINIQKDKNNSKEEIRFTINVGIFSSKFWLSEYDYDKTNTVPQFPMERVSIIRERIGDIKYGHDHWYTLETQKMEWGLIKELTNDVKNYVLPYLDSITNTKELISYFQKNRDVYGNDYRLFFILAEEGLTDQAQVIYSDLLKNSKNENHLSQLLETGRKYNLKSD